MLNALIWKEFKNVKSLLFNMLYFVLISLTILYFNKDNLSLSDVLIMNLWIFALFVALMDVCFNAIDDKNIEVLLSTPLSTKNIIIGKWVASLIKGCVHFGITILMYNIFIQKLNGININVLWIIVSIAMSLVCTMLISTISIIYLKKSKKFVLFFQIIVIAYINMTQILQFPLTYVVIIDIGFIMLFYCIYLRMIIKVSRESIIERSI